jgi:transcriptional regulator with XRE-family HTH domain
MFVFTENQKKRIARNIRRELDRKFPGRGRNRRLAAMVGVSPATVSRWTGGVRTPGMEQLIRMAAAFGVPLHRLCGHSGKRPVRTKSPAYNNVMNLSIGMERTADGAALENMGTILSGLLNRR